MRIETLKLWEDRDDKLNQRFGFSAYFSEYSVCIISM